MNKKVNCWEYFKCGREPGGAKCGERGICGVAGAFELEGVNRGTAGGRVCWAVTESGSAEARADKFCRCIGCVFFRRVVAEEGRAFSLGVDRNFGSIMPLE